jgi:hypothetical protein
MPTRRFPLHVCLLVICYTLMIGCGRGGGTFSPPPTPAFTSTPPTAAEEGTAYTYTVAANSPDMSAVTFALTVAPQGATLTGNTLTWTPTHAESRAANAFTVMATTAKGGIASQNWSVTPNGNVNVTSVITYWGPNGSTNLPVVLPAGLPGPQLFFPQQDGTLLKYAGTQNTDGSVSFLNVPAGYYWLQLRATGFFWTSTSDFDGGQNLIGNPLGSVAPAATTTFDYSISGVTPAPPGDSISAKSDGLDLAEVPLILATPGTSTTVTGTSSFPSFVDFTKIDTIYFLEYDFLNAGGFVGNVLGPEGELSNLSLANGGTNNLTVTLNPSPAAALHLSIQGTAWASVMQGVGPGTPTPSFSSYGAVAQPFLTNGFAPVAPYTPARDVFALLQPQGTGFRVVVRHEGIPFECDWRRHWAAADCHRRGLRDVELWGSISGRVAATL